MDGIWKAAPKFPDVDATAPQRIDVDSFIQIYRDIDDIFEDDDEEDSAPAEASPAEVEVTADEAAATSAEASTKDDKKEEEVDVVGEKENDETA